MDSEQPRAVPGDADADRSASAAPALRASDADRERAASVLRAATADGRISAAEFDERLDLAYRAASVAELDSVLRDLRPAAPWVQGTPTAAKDVGVLSGFVRGGRWLVGDTYRGTAVVSGGVIDLREARFTGPETTIHVGSWISTVYVVVPEDAEVAVTGTGIIGAFTQDRESPAAPARQRINITGVAVCGNVRVVRRLPPAAERRLGRGR